jgi:hypothetical protein
MKPPQPLRFAQMDYRGLEDLLTSSAELRVALGLESVPDHSTFHWFMATTLRLFRRRSRRGEMVAVDATGFSRCPASHYYMRRPARRFLMLSMVVWVWPQVIICAPGVRVGPGSPSRLLPPLVQETVRHGAVRRLLPSADPDAEPTHRWLREEQGIESIIPATGCCLGRDWTPTGVGCNAISPAGNMVDGGSPRRSLRSSSGDLERS